jgi:predicted acyltransferase
MTVGTAQAADASGTGGTVESPGPALGRLVSLDAFRGLTIAGMILVNNPGSWSFIYWPLGHAEWHGWTPTDLIFPYFLFILGVALPFSFSRRLERGARPGDLFKHVVRRSLVLIGLGLAMRAIPAFDFDVMRWPGVLQRIGVVYLVAGGLYLGLDRRGRWWAAGGLLLGYWALLTLVPVPGYGAGDLSQDGNLGAYLDRLLMDGHLYRPTWDPEGLLSSLPAVATALLGVFTGEWLRSGRSGLQLTRGMLQAGALLVFVGLIWDLAFPINKNLWTSSYVVFTGGTALLVLATMYWAIDVRQWRGWWHKPMVVYGMNSIAVFVASGMLSKMMTRVRVGGADGTSLYGWIYEHVFRSWAGDFNGSLAFALSYVLFWLGLMWLMHSRRIYIKI